MGLLKHASLVLVTAGLLSTTIGPAIADHANPPEDEQYRRQAKRIHDRLTGVTASNAAIDAMATRLHSDPSGKTAANFAISISNNPEGARGFYNVTLKNFAAPWTNEEQTVFTPLNDYTATVIGLIRDRVDFREVLYGNHLYHANPTVNPNYNNNNNTHYENLEAMGPVAGDLSDDTILIADSQTAVTGLQSPATAGIMTTRAASMSFFSDGTNRAMFRFTLMNHLCTDLEPLKDTSRSPNRVRRDVSRSPGGDSRIYSNTCVGCHAGMDGMAGAFAYYEWVYNNDVSDGHLEFQNFGNAAEFDPVTGVSLKHHINEDTFEYGYHTVDDSWVNYWRNGPNSVLGLRPGDTGIGWLHPGGGVNGIDTDSKGNTSGNGAKSLGRELSNSAAFAQCQVDKVFKTICLRDPDVFAADRTARDGFVANFTGGGYDMREVFTDVAAYCKGN